MISANAVFLSVRAKHAVPLTAETAFPSQGSAELTLEEKIGFPPLYKVLQQD